MIKKQFTVGSDPEFFVSNGKKIIPSYHFLPGTKDNPFQLEDGYSVLRDNTLVEGNIPPASSKEEFMNNMNRLMNLISSNFLLEDEMCLIHEDSAEYEIEDLAHPEAFEFGCSPYLNAWSGKMEIPVGLDEQMSRPAGFHIHLGYELSSTRITKKNMNKALVRAYDILAMTEFSTEHPDNFRDKFYGGLGKYRMPIYGVEFRSLGSFWTNPKYLGRVYEKVEEVVSVCSNTKNVDLLLKLEMNNPKIGDLLEVKNNLIINKIQIQTYQTV